MGATLAFEVTWRLEHKGVNASSRVVVSGRRALSPRREEKGHLGDDDSFIAEIRKLKATDSPCSTTRCCGQRCRRSAATNSRSSPTPVGRTAGSTARSQRAQVTPAQRPP
jgi:hypothetical protein